MANRRPRMGLVGRVIELEFALLAAGWHIQSAAKNMGCPVSTYHSHIRKLRIAQNGIKYPANPELHIEEVLRKFRDGISAVEIARDLNWTEQLVVQALEHWRDLEKRGDALRAELKKPEKPAPAIEDKPEPVMRTKFGLHNLPNIPGPILEELDEAVLCAIRQER